jgi:2'-5' RNA ligase
LLRFNYALIPVDQTLLNVLRTVAQCCFGRLHDGYILSSNDLAHITLCQFRAESEQAALDALGTFKDKQEAVTQLEEFRYRDGSAMHAGFFWAEFPVRKLATLAALQERCVSHLVRSGIEVLTPVEHYAPHVTLARLRGKLQNHALLASIPSHGLIAVRPTLGVSTECGVFVRELA